MSGCTNFRVCIVVDHHNIFCVQNRFKAIHNFQKVNIYESIKNNWDGKKIYSTTIACISYFSIRLYKSEQGNKVKNKTMKHFYIS